MPMLPLRTAMALGTAGILAAGVLSASAAWAKPAPELPPPPDFQDVTVHDPSVVTDGDDVWVFGSHGASAHTTDLMAWEQHSIDLSQDADNPLFADIYSELAETFEWAQTRTLWAADVIELPDGRYAMYYNACQGSSPRSALGLAVSDAVDGPFENQGVLLKSGMWDEESENAGEIYDARIHPNAVDPDAFYDADGNLWMVYGSYSGGIFILQLDPATGVPLPGQGYGTHLVGGNHSRIEAPTIRYDAETGYYYLFLSFGGLDVSGGYDVRVARSTSPDGPYLDAEGNDLADVKADPALPIFDDASIEPFGVKLMGGHVFTRELGEPGSGPGTGYVSPGHTSWYDDDEGRSFMVFHARFPGTGESHEVRVHQMWMNADGWPVVSPQRYAGETAGKVFRDDVVGAWQLIDLGKDITAAAATPSDIRLEADGTISGDLAGRWKLTGQNTTELTIGGTVYTGVTAPTWDSQYERWSVGLSVVSQQGVTLWGRAVDVLAPEDAVAAVAAAIELGDTSAVTTDLQLPTSGTAGTTIAWSSSAPDVVSDAGVVTRPGIGDPAATATLTATVSNGATSTTVAFTVTVLARTTGVLAGSWSFDGDLADGTGAHAPATTTGDRIQIPGGPAAYVADGVEGSALHLDGTSGVRLADGLVQSSSYSVSMWLRPEALTPYTTAFFAAAGPDSWVSLVPRGHGGVGGSTMVWSGSAWYDAGTGESLAVGTWSHVAFVVDDGWVSVYIDGVRHFHGSGFPDVLTAPGATFALGVNWWDTPFQGDVDELTVWGSALTPQDIAELAGS